ncbi:MAG: cytochrome c oxidase subunit 3 [Bacteroidota bacterium]
MENRNSDTEEQRSMFFHPYNILLSLVLFSITTLFLAFSAAYIYTRFEARTPPIKLPIIFLFNTVILLASSVSMNWAKQSYKNDNTTTYQMALVTTIVLSLIFMVAQFIGWRQLFGQEIFINYSNTASYLYVISGLHFAHVVAGLPFLILFLVTAHRRMKEPVSVLVYFSDPEKLLKLRLLTVYWHFLDALWIYLVLFFYINYWIS